MSAICFTIPILILTNANGLPLCADNHNLIVQLNAILIAQYSGQQYFGPITNGIHLKMIAFPLCFVRNAPTELSLTTSLLC